MTDSHQVISELREKLAAVETQVERMRVTTGTLLERCKAAEQKLDRVRKRRDDMLAVRLEPSFGPGLELAASRITEALGDEP